MKILHRYLLSSFLIDVLVMGLLIVGLIVIFDTALKLDEFLENNGVAAILHSLATYVTAMLPVLLVTLAPTFTLAAAMLTLSSFGRSGELMAMRSCGLSPLQIALPIFGASVLVSGGMYYLSEVYLPNHSAKILEAMALGKGRSTERLRQLAVDGQGSIFYFQRFAPHDAAFENAWIDLRDPESGNWAGRIHARSGAWGPPDERGHRPLMLRDGAEYPVGSELAVIFTERELATDLLPIDIESPGARLRFDSIAELRRKVEAGSNQRHRLILQINSRIAHYLFTNAVLLLIALPLGLAIGERGKWVGMAAAVVLIAVFLGVNETCMSLGERGHIPPLVAAWFPVALFGSVGVCVFANAQG